MERKRTNEHGAEEFAKVAKILEGHDVRYTSAIMPEPRRGEYHYAALTKPPGKAPVCSPPSNVTSPDFTVKR